MLHFTAIKKAVSPLWVINHLCSWSWGYLKSRLNLDLDVTSGADPPWSGFLGAFVCSVVSGDNKRVEVKRRLTASRAL